MDRNEKLQFQQSIETYFEQKHIYELFEKFLKELVTNKPKDPIDYLIKRLKIKDSNLNFKI
jgi:mRNA-degrading endonuclease RelE of RelBE toxin-antitoxin system